MRRDFAAGGRERRQLAAAALACVAACILLVLASCGSEDDGDKATGDEAAKQGGVLRIGLSEDIDHTDPALAYYVVSWQMSYATCVKLLNYPEKPAPEGSQLQPEAADAMPQVSADGKTYTFMVSPRFKFSPPSNEMVTAETFRFAIERVLSPKMQSPGTSFVTDIVGAADVIAGKADQASGITVDGNRLTIRLEQVAPDFLSRIAMPFFCAVPLDTPLDPKGVLAVPAAGPYYIAARSPKRSIVLKRNPNYTGDRVRHLDEIVYDIGAEPRQTLLQIKRGEVDYAADILPPSSHADLYREWGPGSENAKQGKQRYFVNPRLSFFYFALNTDRPIFSDPAVRQAVNYALDRPALLRQSGAHAGTPTDQYLPPGIPGYRDADIYPVDGPDYEKARELMGGRRGKVVLYTCDDSPCPETAQIFQQNLKQIGLDVEIKQFDFIVAATKAGTKGEPFDALWIGWAADYADPYNFLNVLLDGRRIQSENNQNFAYFDDPAFNQKMEEASRLSGDERWEAYAALDEALGRDGAPLAAYSNENDRSFFSRRTGCQLYQPVYGMSLSRLCITE